MGRASLCLSAPTWGDSKVVTGAVPDGPGELVVDIGGSKDIVALSGRDRSVSSARLESRGLPLRMASRSPFRPHVKWSSAKGIPVRAGLPVAVPGSIDRDAGVVMDAANLPFHNFPLKSC